VEQFVELVYWVLLDGWIEQRSECVSLQHEQHRRPAKQIDEQIPLRFRLSHFCRSHRRKS